MTPTDGATVSRVLRALLHGQSRSTVSFWQSPPRGPHHPSHQFPRILLLRTEHWFTLRIIPPRYRNTTWPINEEDFWACFPSAHVSLVLGLSYFKILDTLWSISTTHRLLYHLKCVSNVAFYRKPVPHISFLLFLPHNSLSPLFFIINITMFPFCKLPLAMVRNFFFLLLTWL